MLQAPKDVQVGLNLGVVQLSGTWEPNDTERRAAWELYVELLTRISVVPLAQDHGLLREALTSLYSLFDTTRQILRTHGPDIAEPKRDGEYSFGFLAVVMLNFSLRPLLAQWHPELDDWESQRPDGVSRRQHEQEWPGAARLRGDLEKTRKELTQVSQLLARACGVPDLRNAVPSDDAA